MPQDEFEYRKSTEKDTSSVSRYAQNLTRYIESNEGSEVLRAHQKTVLDDISEYIDQGGRRGYIEMPTGTGKTVLFVTLAKALGYGDAAPPRILVVEPTIDLVRQTVGGSDGDKGFAGFAPDMAVNTFYSETNVEEQSPAATVTVTTYASFLKLANTSETLFEDNGLHTVVKNRVNDEYDVLFFDEGHRAQGESARRVISSLGGDKLILGFSATPDYSQDRRLEEVLPDRIHTLDIEESIEMGMLATVVPISVHAPGREVHQLTTAKGDDYERKSLSGLINDTERNHMITDIAFKAIENGDAPIISCIPGDNMMHPELIAGLLSSRTLINDAGHEIPVVARAITSNISGEERQAIYKDFEQGVVHALAYIDVLNEGWDSQRANVLIAGRPTRSTLTARQRLGRILRTKQDSKPSYIIDIIDDVTSDSIPPANAADALKKPFLYTGDLIGDLDVNQAPSVSRFLGAVVDAYGSVDFITDAHTQYLKDVYARQPVRQGLLQAEVAGMMTTFATPKRLHDKFGVDDYFLKHLKEIDVATHPARIGERAVDVYDVSQVTGAIRVLPEEPLRGHYLDMGGYQFMRLDDISSILKFKYNVEVSERDILTALSDDDAGNEDDIHFAKRYVAVTHRNTAVYRQSTLLRKDTAQRLVAQLK